MPDALRTLTPKQEKFCIEYLIDLNATQAAIRSGYSPKTAAVIATENIRKPNIVARLGELRKQIAEATDITPERVLRELGRIAFADPRKVMTWGRSGVKLIDSELLSDDDAAIVSEVSESTTKEGGSLRLKLHDKLGALEKIGKHLGMFIEKHEHGGPGGGPIATCTWEEFLAMHQPKESKP